MACEFCDTPIPAGSTRCPNCGAMQSSQLQGAPAPTPQPPQAPQPPQPSQPQVVYVQVPGRVVQTQIVNLPRIGVTDGILLTLCCCLPGGILVIVYTNSANNAAARGDVEGYHAAKRKRTFWVWASVILGGALAVLYIMANAASM